MISLRDTLASKIDYFVDNLKRPEFTCMDTPSSGYVACQEAITNDYELVDDILKLLKDDPFQREIKQQMAVLLLDIWKRDGLEVMAAKLRAIAQEDDVV